MQKSGSRPTVCIDLPCFDAEQFHREYAATLARRFFVAQTTPTWRSEVIRLEVRFADGQVRVSGTAVADSVDHGQPGLLVHLTDLDPHSIQFSLLGPQGESKPGRQRASIALPLPPPALPEPDLAAFGKNRFPESARALAESGDSPNSASWAPRRESAGRALPDNGSVRDFSRTLPDGAGGAAQADYEELSLGDVGLEDEDDRAAAEGTKLRERGQPPDPGSQSGGPGQADPAVQGAPGPPRRVRLAVIIASLAAVVAAVAVLAVRCDTSAQHDSVIASHISTADERIATGRLVGPGGDHALDHLLAAKKLAPDHAGIKQRLDALADKFEELAGYALRAGNVAEAAAHLQAVLDADPNRKTAVDRLAEIEERMRRGSEPTP